MTTLSEKQEAMRRRHRPFTPRKDFDLGDVQAKLRCYVLLKKGWSRARVAAELGVSPLWIAQWQERGYPLD